MTQVTRKTPNVNEAVKKINELDKNGTRAIPDSNIQETKEVEEEYKNSAVIQNPDIDIEKLEAYWKDFAASLTKEPPRIVATVNSGKVEINDKKQIVVLFQNQTQLNHFSDSIRKDFVKFLCEKLAVETIDLVPLLDDQQNNITKPNFLTDAEKLDYLAQKNPAFNKLRQDFDLDFD